MIWGRFIRHCGLRCGRRRCGRDRDRHDPDVFQADALAFRDAAHACAGVCCALQTGLSEQLASGFYRWLLVAFWSRLLVAFWFAFLVAFRCSFFGCLFRRCFLVAFLVAFWSRFLVAFLVCFWLPFSGFFCRFLAAFFCYFFCHDYWFLNVLVLYWFILFTQKLTVAFNPHPLHLGFLAKHVSSMKYKASDAPFGTWCSGINF